MRQFSAIAANTANSTALRFSTGNAPGNPRQTGQTLVLGGSPNRVDHEQKIFVTVRSSTCTSSPTTGSYRARAATDESATVTILSDYKTRVATHGIARKHLSLAGRAQIFFQWDFKVHQLITSAIAHTRKIKMCAGERSRHFRNIKKQKSCFGGMRFYRLGNELRILDFFSCFLAQSAFHLFSWKWQRVLRTACRRVNQPALNVVLGSRRDLGPARGNQLRAHAGQFNWLVSIISHHDKNWHKAELTVMHAENLCLVRHVIGIQRNGDRLIRVLIMRRIRPSRLRLRHDKLFRRQTDERRQRDTSEYRGPKAHASAFTKHDG